MTKILIVDSNASACLQVSQDLAAQRSHWEVLQASSADEALKLLAERSGSRSIDVIVTEARLQDGSSSDFLEKVRQDNERVIRLTLSADGDAESEIGGARANQRFLLKPFSPDHLATTIERSLRLRDSMYDQSLKKFMSTVSSVPAVPAIYDEMMAELASPHSSLMKVGEIVETDAGLTLTILKVVNSAFYGINKRVESVGQAVALLGVHLIKNITLTTKVFARFKGSTLSAARLSQLNDEAMRIGALSNQFARYAKLARSSVDHCQIAGMMANVGELVTTAHQPDASLGSMLTADLIGAAILHGWYMPDGVVEAVALQHESPPQNIDIVSPLVVLHSIRYLQANFTRTSDSEQEAQCRQYLCQFVPDDIVTEWLQAYQAIEQLTASPSSRAA